MTGVSTEPGGAYSSGAPGLTSIPEVHVLLNFDILTSQGFTLTEYHFGIAVLELIAYCETALINSGVNYLWFINNSIEVWEKIKSCSNIPNITTCDFSTLYTSLTHDKIKNKLKLRIKWTFKPEMISILELL